MISGRWWLTLVVVGTVVRSGGAVAQASCPLMEGSREELALVDDEARLRFLERGLDQGARRARLWAWSWAAVQSTAIAYDLLSGLWLFPGDGGRVDGIVAAAASTVGLATLIVRPLPVMGDQRWLARARRSGAGAADEPGRCALLAEAERRLLRDAQAEALGRSARAHVVNFGFNIAVGLVLGAGFGHWGRAALAALGGTAVAELQTITQPSGELQLLRRYRAADLSPSAPERPLAWAVTPLVSAGYFGATISARW